MHEGVGLKGHGVAELSAARWNLLSCGARIVVARVEFGNLITTAGDEHYARRASGVAGASGPVTGMRVGVGATQPNKSGAGSFIAAVGSSGSSRALDPGFPTVGPVGTNWRVTWRVTWPVGEATQANISEAVLTIGDPTAQVPGTAADTIARALILPTITKAAIETLTVTWMHDIAGS